jgi:hypothetical protein
MLRQVWRLGRGRAVPGRGIMAMSSNAVRERFADVRSRARGVSRASSAARPLRLVPERDSDDDALRERMARRGGR